MKDVDVMTEPYIAFDGVIDIGNGLHLDYFGALEVILMEDKGGRKSLSFENRACSNKYHQYLCPGAAVNYHSQRPSFEGIRLYYKSIFTVLYPVNLIAATSIARDVTLDRKCVLKRQDATPPLTRVHPKMNHTTVNNPLRDIFTQYHTTFKKSIHKPHAFQSFSLLPVFRDNVDDDPSLSTKQSRLKGSVLPLPQRKKNKPWPR